MALTMNKQDLKLIIIILVIAVLTILIINTTKKEADTVLVYYEDKLIKTIDLNKDGEYTVDGFLGDVVIEVKDKKVRVKKENSPRNICSKEGYISDNTKPLICLPNKIIIKIASKDNGIDGVV